jgi:DNA-binding CsgD family transcriptional regulator
MNNSMKAGQWAAYILICGITLGLLSALIIWGKYRFVLLDNALELYTLLIGGIFIGVGIWVGSKFIKPKTIIQEKIVIEEKIIIETSAAVLTKEEVILTKEAENLISPREHHVLQLLAKGMSNEEIAAALFVSQNTVKTHLSNLYFKLDVKRRTQAVEKARVLGLIG